MSSYASAANRLERISNLSVEEFISEYLQKNRPVIVTGAMVHWKALETWNPDALASRFGNERVQVYGDLFRLAAITTLSEYLKNISAVLRPAQDQFPMYGGIAIWQTMRGCHGPTRCLPSFKTTGRAPFFPGQFFCSAVLCSKWQN